MSSRCIGESMRPCTAPGWPTSAMDDDHRRRSRSLPLCGLRNRTKTWLLAASVVTSGCAVQAAPGEKPEPVFRFWSGVHQSHFYTTKPKEAKSLIANYRQTDWRYEGIAFLGAPQANTASGIAPVHQYRARNGSHFDYSIDAAAAGNDAQWRDNGPAFYAFADGLEPLDAEPVYAFKSAITGARFFTAEAAERDAVLAGSPDNGFSYEGIAWYAYPAHGRPSEADVLRLSWTPPAEGDGVQGYKVYLQLKQHAPEHEAAELHEIVNLTSLEDPASPGIEYAIGTSGLALRSGDLPCFRITAYGESDESPFSDEVCTFIP